MYRAPFEYLLKMSKQEFERSCDLMITIQRHFDANSLVNDLFDVTELINFFPRIVSLKSRNM